VNLISSELEFGDAHLIGSLLKLRQVYSQPEWEDSYMFADYVLFLLSVMNEAPAYQTVLEGTRSSRWLTWRLIHRV
jgi:hypothetical protein